MRKMCKGNIQGTGKMKTIQKLETALLLAEKQILELKLKEINKALEYDRQRNKNKI